MEETIQKGVIKLVEEEEESYLLCEACGQFYKEGKFHDCRLSEHEEILAERQWIERNKEKSEEEQLEEMMKPLTERKSYKELLSATILELARQDLQETGRVQSKEFYEEEAKRHLLREALRTKYSKIPEKERLIYYRSLRDQYEQWKKRLFGEYKDIKGQNLFLCPVCRYSAKGIDEVFRHFAEKHPKEYQWYLRVSSLLEGRYDYYRHPDYYPKGKETKEEKGIDILEDKKEQLSKAGEDKDKTYLRNLTILTALTRHKKKEE